MPKPRRSLAEKAERNLKLSDRRVKRREVRHDASSAPARGTGPVVMDITRGTSSSAPPELAREIKRAANDQDSGVPAIPLAVPLSVGARQHSTTGARSNVTAPMPASASSPASRVQREDTDVLHMQVPVSAPAIAREVRIAADEPGESEFAKNTFAPGGPVNLSVTLPREIAEEYVRQADAAHQPLSAFLSERLSNCITHASRTQLVLTDSARLTLGRLLASALMDEDELVRIVRGLVGIRVRSITGAVDARDVLPVEFAIDMPLIRRAAAFVTTAQTFEQIIEQFCRRGLQQLYG